MPDREKVMTALKCVAELETAMVSECREKGCPYAGMDCERAVAADALALLMEQVPRVMTVEEAKEYLTSNDEERIPLYVEYYFKCPLWIKWTNENLMQNIKGITAWEFNEYNTQCEFGWRVWTIKPSPEQMRETPWEGDSDGEVY